MDYNEDIVDETILALLWLVHWEEGSGDLSVLRTWNGNDSYHVNRLHDEEYISDPAPKPSRSSSSGRGRGEPRSCAGSFSGHEPDEP